MLVMSVPAQQKPSAKRTGKRITFFGDQPGDPMKETSQHPDGAYFVPGGTAAAASESGQSEAASTVTSNPEAPHMYFNSVIFSPDKGDQNRGHYQQTVPMKWAHPEPGQQQQQRAASWTAMPNWAPAFPNLTRTQNAFAKALHETPPGLQLHQQPTNAVKSRALEWEQQQQQTSQIFQETLKPGALNAQQQSVPHPGGSSVLQSFQLAFGQPKQHLPAYYQTFQGSRNTLPNPPNYSNSKQSSLHLQQLQNQEQMQRQQQQQQHVIQQQIQQHQQIIRHPHVQLQQQQQQLHHEQQQQQQKMQQQRQQLQIQQQMQHQQSQQQNPHVLDCFSAAQNAHPQPVVVHSQESTAPAPPKIQEPLIQDITPEPQQQPSDPLQAPPPPEPSSQSQAQLRRSRRLSKEGGAPSDNPFLCGPSDQSGPENGARDVQAAPTGVIQSTRRKRRVSQEVNLEMLAQEASERKSPSLNKEPHRPWSPAEPESMNAKRPRDDSLLPLVIPVSVPVRRRDPSSPDRDGAAVATSWPHRPPNHQDLGRADHKPSVIVTRRRSLRNSLSESSEQNDGTEGERDDDGKKSKRRPRPEPLFIPPPKPSLFIAPPVYSSITPYQSHLRSPVRLADNPITMPPYTPPPILSPVREGSGLYFSTFLSSAAASGPGLPPPATPKSATRSLLRSNSCDITPPVLSAMSETTPVSIEPRINIGSRYQAEVPELRQRSAVELDRHRAELVWAPPSELEGKPDFQDKVEDLMHLACSSVLYGGGTNQELALHCLYESKGDIMAALSLLMLRDPIFPKTHHLSSYHYSGSDSWTAAERRLFNKGMSTCKKDFFMVQKQVTTKTVAQCVEFYYTYKKHVKMGRNGALIYGENEPPESRTAEEEQDHKVGHASQRLEPQQQEEDSRKWDGSADRKQDVCPTRVTHALPSTENLATVLIMKSQAEVGREQPVSRVIQPPQTKPRFDGSARRPSPPSGNKASTGQEGEFPCKKCGSNRSAEQIRHISPLSDAALPLREQHSLFKALQERPRLRRSFSSKGVTTCRFTPGIRSDGTDPRSSFCEA
ncbi:hypothetical protein CCH79_00007997, partial [Gambusia affinis]